MRRNPQSGQGVRLLALALAAASVVAVGCSPDSGSGRKRSGQNPPSSAPEKSRGESGREDRPGAPPSKGSVKVDRTVTTGLKSPWGLAPLPDGDLLVSSRDQGTILRIDGESGKKTEVGAVPGVEADGEGGLLGIAVPPDGARMIYAYLTTASDNRVVRMLYDAQRAPGEQLGAPDTVFRGIPKGFVHNGGRIAFGPDRMLYVGTGETGDEGLAQDSDSLAGKILRMTPDGQPPGHGSPEPDSVVYSLGHRNVQGLAWDREKRLWAAEFGQDTWDELNLIEPGRNYGWPDVEGRAGEKGFVDPVARWRTADASPSGIAVARGSVWVAGLRGERLWRVPLRGTKASAKPQAFLRGEYGRLRTVVSDGRDGLWLVTSETDSRGTPGKGDDRILRLTVR